MRRLFVLIACLSLLAAALLTGCGSDSSSDTTAPAITKAAFVKKANQICERIHKAYLAKGFAMLAKVEKEMPDADPLTRELAVTTKIFLPTYRGQLQELRELGTPPGDAKTLNAYFDSYEATLAKWKQDPRQFRIDQANFGNPYKKSFTIAERYGIRVCGQP